MLPDISCLMETIRATFYRKHRKELPCRDFHRILIDCHLPALPRIDVHVRLHSTITRSRLRDTAHRHRNNSVEILMHSIALTEQCLHTEHCNVQLKRPGVKLSACPPVQMVKSTCSDCCDAIAWENDCLAKPDVTEQILVMAEGEKQELALVTHWRAEIDHKLCAIVYF